MSPDTIRRTFILAIVASLYCAALAQPKDNSPLSRIGIGEPADMHFAASASMGGLGSAFRHLHQVNIKNPASLGYLEATALEVGMFARHNAVRRGDFSSGVWSGNLEYLSISIPLFNPINELLERRERSFSWGLNASVMPVSQVGYFISSRGEIDSLGMVSRSFQGSGGTYRFNLGNGWRYRDLSFGVNVGYLFGRTNYSSETIFEEIAISYRHIARSGISYRGLLWNMGAQYDIVLKPSKANNRQSITIGTHYNSNTSFSTDSEIISFVRNVAINHADTASYEVGVRGDGRMPAEFGFGVHVQESNKWSAGVDFSTVSWNNYSNEARPEPLSNTWRIAAGGSYTPDLSSISSYFSRVEYRSGVFYQTDPRSLEGEQARQYGITVGAGMPFVFQRYFSYINVGLEVGRAGTANTLRENYIRGRIGIVLNDNQWFIKRRYY